MGFYRRIDTRMHGDKRYAALSKPQPNAQSLFEWLIHGPMSNSIGLYPAGMAAMAEARGWPVKPFAIRFQELLQNGMVSYCEEHRLLLITTFLKHNPASNPKTVRGWFRLLDSLPECHLQNDWIHILKLYGESFGQWFPQLYTELYAIRSRNSPSPSPSPSPTPSPVEAGSEPPPVAEAALDPALKAILDECPHLALVNNGASSGFWDQVLGACEPYPMADGRWLGVKLRAWDTWFKGNPGRRSRDRKRLESRLMGWLSKDLEQLARQK